MGRETVDGPLGAKNPPSKCGNNGRLHRPLEVTSSSVKRPALTSCCFTTLRALPILPAIFRPGNTREGVVEAPVEPCSRWLLLPWVIRPRWWCQRLMVPACHVCVRVGGDTLQLKNSCSCWLSDRHQRLLLPACQECVAASAPAVPSI
eukprot:848902-Pelagomonas_calceolata.AAC.3